MDTLAGRAGTNGISFGWRIGTGRDTGSRCDAWVLVWHQTGLFATSLARSVASSIRTHHSAGLNDAPNMRRRNMRAHTALEQMHFTADQASCGVCDMQISDRTCPRGSGWREHVLCMYVL